jgi:molybdopterin-guanine dinucleotide biosynthesis protein A
MNGAAIVLCGGLSRRMGRPKESLPFGHETLLRRVVRLVGSVTETVVVVAAPIADPQRLDVPSGVAIVRDPVLGQGPLRGIVTGLAALPDRIELVYVTAVDVPFLNPAWIDYLAEVIEDDDLAIPFVGSQYHPLSALYRRPRALPAARSLLQAGRLRTASLMEPLRSRIVLEAELERIDPGLGTLRNLNTPEEYRAALIDADLVEG